MIRHGFIVAAVAFLAPFAQAQIGHALGDPRARLLAHVFDSGGVKQVPMDIQTVELALTFNVAASTATGVAWITFAMPAEGMPYFTLAADPSSAKLNGQAVTIKQLLLPDGTTSVRSVSASVASTGQNTLELRYTVPRDSVSFPSFGGGVGFLTSMGDVGSDGNFFEAYGPSNIEADPYRMTMTLEVLGARQAHQVFTNGSIVDSSTELSRQVWRIEFPDWYTTSSFYAHLTAQAYVVKRIVVRGMERQIPVTVYSQRAAPVDAAIASLPGVFQELESTFGPYTHASFTALISGSGGMEHNGATITSLDALEHELTHSWFARGVMPSTGRDGWMDEAIASWRDHGYQRSQPDSSRGATNMAGFSIFNPFTPYNVYRDGRTLLSELDGLFANATGGLRPLLQKWFGVAKRQAVTTEEFLMFVESETRTRVAPLFDRYVYGKTLSGRVVGADIKSGKHPPKLTREEILSLR